MPYPFVHVLFFVLCINAVALYAIPSLILGKEHSFNEVKPTLLLLFIGSIFALFPDITIIYNLLVNHNLEHCWIGPVPTHSFLFSSLAFLLGALVGIIIYKKNNKAIYLGIFAEAASLSHLVLDDAFEKGFVYLYPMYNEEISIFSLMDVSFKENGLFMYLLNSSMPILFFLLIIMMTLFTLRQFGFDLRYKSKKN